MGHVGKNAGKTLLSKRIYYILRPNVQKLTVQRLFPAYLRLGLQGVEHSGADEQIGERTNDQR